MIELKPISRPRTLRPLQDLKELAELESLLDVQDLDSLTSDELKQLINELRTRLREVNSKLRRNSVNAVKQEVNDTGVEDDINSTLASLPLEDAKNWLYSQFTPDIMNQFKAENEITFEKIKSAIQAYCKENSIALIYDIWK